MVDEAHRIYLWGLEASGKSKNFSVHVTPQDVGQFRPSYGNLGQQLMATEDVPILLMSATCRPQAVQSILDSLSIVPKHISLIQGELVRPELQYIRIYLARPLDTAEDLKPIIPSILDVSNKDLPPMLIYSGTQTGTMTVIEAVCNARGTPEDIRNGNSDCI